MTPQSQPSIRRILAATDLAEDGAIAVAEANRLAMTFDAALGVVNVLPPGVPPDSITTSPTSVAQAERHESEAREAALLEATRTLLGSASGRPFDAFVERGTAARSIVARARNYAADLIVVGTNDRHGLERAILGSVAQQVARTAPCSVLVARPGGPSNGRILAACDLATTSRCVLEWAGMFSRRLGLPVVAAHAVETNMSDVALVATSIFSGAVPVQPDKAEVQAIEEAAMGAMHAELTGAGVVASTEILTGPAREVIAAHAKQLGASLIVVATHSRKGLPRLVMGSVAEGILRDAPCSVLIAR